MSFDRKFTGLLVAQWVFDYFFTSEKSNDLVLYLKNIKKGLSPLPYFLILRKDQEQPVVLPQLVHT